MTTSIHGPRINPFTATSRLTRTTSNLDYQQEAKEAKRYYNELSKCGEHSEQEGDVVTEARSILQDEKYQSAPIARLIVAKLDSRFAEIWDDDSEILGSKDYASRINNALKRKACAENDPTVKRQTALELLKELNEVMGSENNNNKRSSVSVDLNDENGSLRMNNEYHDNFENINERENLIYPRRNDENKFQSVSTRDNRNNIVTTVLNDSNILDDHDDTTDAVLNDDIVHDDSDVRGGLSDGIQMVGSILPGNNSDDDNTGTDCGGDDCICIML